MSAIADKYEIIQPLGSGSYGDVYLVKHRDLSIRYALKVLNKTLCADERFTERFKREAEILLRFSHPGSVQLRDFGQTAEGRYYMAMDFVEGQLLGSAIEKAGHFSIKQSLDVLGQILEVLEHAHSHGIIHRDIKPDNIMVVPGADGRLKIKILDFGIAKIKEEALSNSATIEGTTIGTPHYMSPEQAAGESTLDARVDIYACGVIGYEMIAGYVPFSGETVVQTLLMHLTRPPLPFPKELGVPQEIIAMIMKALAKSKDDRFQSCAEFLKEVQALQRKDEPAAVTAQEKLANPSASTVEIMHHVNADLAESKKTKILCLDDNEMILNILKHILEKEGYEVFTANDCSAIHDILFAHNVSLLVSDVQMPGLPGTRVCQMLKASLKELKIILFSNIPERDLEKLSLESKADDFISKNARPEEWITKVRAVLARETVTSL